MPEEKSSVEERLEKLEKYKSRDQAVRERAEKLEELKKTPIKYVPKDPTRIHKSKKQILEEKQAKKDEDLEVKKFLAERKKEKEAKGGVQKEEKEEKVPGPKIEVKKAGRPKKIE